MSIDSNSPVPEFDLTAQWRAARCPIIDGIVFGDGRVRLVGVDWQKRANGRLGLVIEPGGWTTLADFHKDGKLQWTGVIVLCEAEDPTRGIRVLGGEGGLGSEGFVANVRADEGTIVWIASFSNSNPFEVVQIRSDDVLAKTNLGALWRFPLDAPDRIAFQ